MDWTLWFDGVQNRRLNQETWGIPPKETKINVKSLNEDRTWKNWTHQPRKFIDYPHSRTHGNVTQILNYWVENRIDTGQSIEDRNSAKYVERKIIQGDHIKTFGIMALQHP